MKPITTYNIKKINIDYNKESFILSFDNYRDIPISFIEIEAFIFEYDLALHNYLMCKLLISDKILEGVDIGYDFNPMITEFFESFIEFGLIEPAKK